MNNIPIACYNISGMQEFPKEDCAVIKITPKNDIDDNINRLATKIDEYFKSEEKINLLCKNGLTDIKTNYSWEKISTKFINIYKTI